MIVYRLAHFKYANDVSGTGAKLTGGRWNTPGIAMLYTSEHISLALLEVLANAHTLEQLQSVRLLEISIPVKADETEIKLGQLKTDWWNDFDYTRWIGDEMMKANEALIIKCPSAIINSEHNYLINPSHAHFKRVKATMKTDFRFDERLFKTSAT